MATTDTATSNDQSLTRSAIGLAAATVVAWIVLVILDHQGGGWFAFPVLGLAAAVVAWRAGGTSPKNRPAFVAFLIGLVAIAVFVAFVIFE